MPRPIRPQNADELYEAIAHLRTAEECRRFFEDLCAVTELAAMEQRFTVARQLLEGRVYSDILSSTGASSATVSRVNRMLNYGNGAVRELLTRGAEKGTEE